MVISETEGSLRKSDVHDRRLSLIDVSSADDSLIDPLSSNPFHHQHSVNAFSENEERTGLLHTPNSKILKDAASKLEEWKREPQPNETIEVEKPKKNSKCNLRKSLAWDSAFFTSAGVLDPEEMSSIIEGVEKDEKHVLRLPGIQEDVRKSCESISSLESDSLTLGSLEADLFEDVRASIQKSNRVLNVSANSKVPSGVARFQTGDSSKKVAMASHDKMKAPSPKSPSADIQGIGKMTKKNPIFPHLSQPVAKRGEPSILKQPKVQGKSSPSPTISSKGASLSDQHVKSEKDKTKQIIRGKVSSVSNASVIRGSRVMVPKPILSSKSPSHLLVAVKTKSTTSTSFGSNLTGNIGKSPSNSSKRKVDAGTRKPLSSCSAVRTPSRIASRDKIGSSNSSLSSMLSATKLSSSISPASSISDWSSESSSSTSMAKYRSNSSRTSFDSISSKKDLLDIDARQGSSSQNPQSDSSLERKETQHTGFISQCARTAAAGTVLPPAPMKPSGLRLPSPKIGFFDGAKSSVRSPHGGMQPHSVVPRSLPKHGARSVSPSEGQNKAKHGKLQPARSIRSIENKKFNNQPTSHAIPRHESSDALIKASSALQNAKSSTEVSMEVQNKTYLKTDAGNLEANNTVAEGNLIGVHDLNLGSTQDNGSLDNSVDIINSEIKGSTRSVDTRATSMDEMLKNSDCSNVENSTSSEVGGECLLVYGPSNFPKAEAPALISNDIGKHISDASSLENKEVFDISMDKTSPGSNSGMHSHYSGATLTNGDHNPCVSSATLENTSPSHVVEKAPVFCQLDLINDVRPLSNNQENPHYYDQVDCLSRQVGLTDINLETQKKFNGDSLYISQPDVSFQDKSDGLGLSSHNELLDCPKRKELLKGSFTPSLSLSPASSDMPACARRPFDVKDSLCNMDGLVSVVTESTIAVVKPTNLSLTQSIMKENN